jgi:hypothetical protein
MLRLLAAAADLRAAGKSWEAVAANLSRAADTCRRWPARFRAAWDDLYRVAERNQITEARAEATAVLRTQLRLEDTKEKRDAAKALLAAASRGRPAKTEPRDPSINDFSDQLSDDEVQDLADERGPPAGVNGA